MKICCISDLHGYLPTIPDCDLLLIAGDLNGFSKIVHQCSFLEGAFKKWVGEITGRGIEVICVAGNHDWLMQDHPLLWKEIYQSYGEKFHYLEDNSIVLRGLKIFGTPGSLPFYNWAFNYPEEKIEHVLQNAEGADIIISHGPAYGYCDLVMRPTLENVGSRSLLEAVQKIQPRLLICGHIHSGYGIKYIWGTKVVSCSVVNENYECDKEHQPITLEL